MADAYKIGPNLADKIIDTIRRVGDTPYMDGRYVVPTRFEDAPQYHSLYRGTFTGTWATGQTAVVTLANDTASTMAVTNYCVKISGDTSSTAKFNVLFGDAGGTMSVLEIEHSEALYRGTYTGSWAIGQKASVTLADDPSRTMEVTNYCVTIDGNDASSAQLNVIFGDVGGTMSVLEIQQPTCTLILGGVDLTVIPGYDTATIQLLGHPANDTASTSCYSLQWYSVTQCGTAT